MIDSQSPAHYGMVVQPYRIVDVYAGSDHRFGAWRVIVGPVPFHRLGDQVAVVVYPNNEVVVVGRVVAQYVDDGQIIIEGGFRAAGCSLPTRRVQAPRRTERPIPDSVVVLVVPHG